jgi:UDP-N-acetyl-D-mannosaminuronate dehydrogenase
MNSTAQSLLAKIHSHDATIGIIGLGYVGLPLALAFVEKGYRVLGFDTDPDKVAKIERGECYIRHIDPDRLSRAIGGDPSTRGAGAPLARDDRGAGGLDTQPRGADRPAAPDHPGREGGSSPLTPDFSPGESGDSSPLTPDSSPPSGRVGANSKFKIQNSEFGACLSATTDFSRLSEPDAILICVPTPLTTQRDPDMTYVRRAAFQVREALRPGQLIVLESTTYPGTTDELILPILEGIGDRRQIRRAEWPAEGPTRPGWSPDWLPAGGERRVHLKSSGRQPAAASEPAPLDESEPEFLEVAEDPSTGGAAAPLARDDAKGDDASTIRPGEDGVETQPASAGRPAAADPSGRAGDSSLLTPDSSPGESGDSSPLTPDSSPEPGEGGGQFKIQNSKFKIGKDFFLAFSPEREDPGNRNFGTTNTPKVVGGVDETSGDLAEALYSEVVERTVRVSSARVAEAAKLTENIFRAVNIALVNELKVVYDRMGIDIWEVLDAAETKPFGFMRFNPGPGWGGHCIPLDPFYLSWKAREAGVPTKFIELAGEVNVHMPEYVIEKLILALNQRGRSAKGSSVVVLGLAYKRDIDDPRESPAFEIIDLLLQLGAEVSYHDPHIPRAPRMRTWPDLPPLHSIDLTPERLQSTDAVVIVTDHAAVDYDMVAANAPLIIDTRGVLRGRNTNIVKA